MGKDNGKKGVSRRGEICQDARIVLGGVAPIPWRAVKAEAFLRGKRIDAGAADRTAEIALEPATPLKDNGYKIDLAKALVRRSLASV